MTGLRILSFNLRVDDAESAGPSWAARREAVASIIRFHDPHVMGVQEALPDMLADLTDAVDGMEWFGVARDGADDEHCAIFWRPDRITLATHDTFWLSETPDVPGSRSWDSAFPRIATWGQFLPSEWRAPVYLFNTHFDHDGDRARRESASLLREQVERIAGSDPAVVMGDLNAPPNSPPYQILTNPTRARPLRDARRESASPPHGPTATFHGFEPHVSDGPRIDYIFVRGPLAVQRYGTLTDWGEEQVPSDHFPVFAEIVPRPSAS